MQLSLPICVLLAAISFQDAEGLSIGRIFGQKKAKIGMPSLPEQGRPKPKGVKGDKDLLDIISQNDDWIAEKKKEDPAFFEKLGSGHSPNYFWIGCADARVPANEIMGEPAGTVFVSRSVANMVVNTDSNLLSALQYAVDYLKIPHIIVCGHYECGGVRAAVTRFNHQAPLENWLRNIRDVYRMHRKELDAIKDPEVRHKRLVDLNVIEQCINVYKTASVQRRRLETKMEGAPFATPRIHGVVFDPKDGILKRLDIDFKKLSIDGIYDLYADYEDVVEDISPSIKGVAKTSVEWPTLAPEPVGASTFD